LQKAERIGPGKSQQAEMRQVPRRGRLAAGRVVHAATGRLRGCFMRYEMGAYPALSTPSRHGGKQIRGSMVMRPLFLANFELWPELRRSVENDRTGACRRPPGDSRLGRPGQAREAHFRVRLWETAAIAQLEFEVSAGGGWAWRAVGSGGRQQACNSSKIFPGRLIQRGV